jgi:hypothetical protein
MRLLDSRNCLALALLASLAISVLPAQTVKSRGDWPIITRRGDQLYEGSRPFRFFGLDAPNLGFNESQIRADRSNRFPDEFEIRDTLGGLQREGARATRLFTLTVYSPLDHGVATHITGRRSYNEEAFRCLDRVIALAHEYDIRLIVPFIASQSFERIRGVDEFAELAGKPGGAFWTDEEVKDDFRDLLRFVLNRRNTVNGILYKDDPAILAWQLGNEFNVYYGDRKLSEAEWSPRILTWSQEMAAYIKTIDNRHLLMEAGGADRAVLLDDPNIDIISDHLYEYWNRLTGQRTDLASIAADSRNMCKGKKPLIVDEFGLGTTENQRSLMNTIRDDGIVGGLMWSIRCHRRDGGWYYHNETGTPVNSFHVPGFAAGFGFDETRILDLLRSEAYLIRDQEAPPISLPSPAPVLIPQGDGFTWKGSTGAASYTLERAENQDGPWTVLSVGLQDSVLANVTEFEITPPDAQALRLYADESRKQGKNYFYRLKAVNAAGETGYSNVLSVQ